MLSSTMGQYIVPTGLDLTMPLCDMLAEPIILAPALNVFGFTADNCPPVVVRNTLGIKKLINKFCMYLL